MKFKIHRGTKEIGGSCVEIWSETTRIVIDLGMPLVYPDKSQYDKKNLTQFKVSKLIKQGILPNIKDLYEKDGHSVLLISHAHQDHYGLINYLHKNTKIYLGEATLRLIELTKTFTRQDYPLSNTKHFKSGEKFMVGDIQVTPYLMDHSAFDAYAFLIEVNGKSIFYSGDFRNHGRKAKVFKWFIHNTKKHIDYLLLEGTTIGRNNNPYPSETELEMRFADTFKNSKGINLIYTSGQNIDRLVSIYKACKNTGKTFIIDFYIANILKELSQYASLPYPSSNFPDIKVFFPSAQRFREEDKKRLLYPFTDYKITKDTIGNQYNKVVMLVRPSMIKDLKDIKNLDYGTFIYSLWDGYKKDKSTKKLLDFIENKNMIEQQIHTSGHADINTLKKMVRSLKPKYIVPIHTFRGDTYEKIFTDSTILKVDDNETVTIL